MKSKIEKIKMSGILVMHFQLGAGGANRIVKGFMDKKNPKKTYIFWLLETPFGQNHGITVQNSKIFIDFYE